MKQILIIFILFYCINSKKLYFQKNNFKILQVSDTHFSDKFSPDCEEISITFGPCTFMNSTYFLSRVLDKETPDLVIFSGDLIDWRTKNSTWSLDTLIKPVISRKINWIAVLGNHDGQSGGKNRTEVMKYLSQMPYSISQMGPTNVYGSGNYILNILKDNNESKVQLLLVDSGAYSHIKAVNGYDWIHASQSKFFINNTNKDLVKLGYFHIPLPEYNIAVQNNKISGSRNEDESPAKINGGFFSTLEQIPNVIGVFSGHDHVNDYCVLYYGIQLCYGGGGGYGAYGKIGFPRRYRIVNILNNGDEISTYKILDTKKLDTVDYELIYSKTNPSEVDMYMEKRKYIPYILSLKDIIFIVICSLFVLLIFLFLIRKKLSRCVQKIKKRFIPSTNYEMYSI